jgi:3-oxoacid CoA-transferase A subunit
MQSKIYRSLDDVVADIPDGASIMFPGFGNTGIPRNLIAALHRQGARDLTGISNGTGGRMPNQIDVGTLISAGQMKKMICAFTSPTHPSRLTDFVRMYNNGEIDAETVPQGTLAERIRAAAAGIGGFYTPTGVGTEIADGKECREINGRRYILEHPLAADYAFIRAWKADTLGNLQFRLAQRNFNPIMAMAATTTIVEVEQDIVEAGEIDPDHIHTPGIYVQRMVRIPPDGIWD